MIYTGMSLVKLSFIYVFFPDLECLEFANFEIILLVKRGSFYQRIP